MTLTPHQLLVLRSKIEWSYNSTLPKGLRGLWNGKTYLTGHNQTLYLSLVILTIELYLCSAFVFTSRFVPMEGQCSVNIQISMFDMCTTVGKAVYSIQQNQISTVLWKKKMEMCFKNIRCNAYHFIHIYFYLYSKI